MKANQEEDRDPAGLDEFEVIDENDYDFEFKQFMKIFQNLKVDKLMTSDHQVLYMPRLDES